MPCRALPTANPCARVCLPPPSLLARAITPPRFFFPYNDTLPPGQVREFVLPAREKRDKQEAAAYALKMAEAVTGGEVRPPRGTLCGARSAWRALWRGTCENRLA